MRWRPAVAASSRGRSSSSTSSLSSSSPGLVAAAFGAAKGRATRKGNEEEEWTTLIDLGPLHSVPKMVRPISKQLPTESRRLWDSVTSRLLRKEFGEATRAKHIIEQRQRDEAAERKRRGIECVNPSPPSFLKCVYADCMALFFFIKVRADVLRK